MRVDPLQILTKLAAVQNIPTRRVTPPFEGLEEFDYGLRRSLDPQFDWQEFGQLLLDSTPENTLLLVEGTFELHFALFRIPDEKNTVFLIGPWTVGPRTPSARKWVRRYLGEAGEAAVQEYYNGVKILEASDFYGALRVVVDTMFGCTVPVQELKEFLPFQFHPDTRYFHEPEFQKEIPVTMLEQRYESENRILDAVARGDEEAAIEAMHQHSRFTYGGRFEGTLYQQKNKMIVLNTLLRKEVSFKILETNRQRRRAVGSISVVAREARKELAQKFWDEVEVGKVYTGKVKSLTNFGAFVDLGGVDGRIGLTDLTWLRVKSPAEVVSIGDTVEVTVKDIDRENNRVSLIYKKTEDNPWEKIKTMYQVGDVVPVKIMSLTTFGAFAQIIPGIDGLIHISQIARERVEKVADKLSVGQVVDAKITELDYDRHRASLSIKALLTEEAPEEEAAEDETPAEE